MALPPEIIAKILLNIHEARPRHLCHDDGNREERERIKSLNACCFINRNWGAQSTLMLYSEFKHNGDENSFAQLWYFLRTIVEKPQLATFVKHLDLRKSYLWGHQCKEEAHSQKQRSRRRELRELRLKLAPIDNVDFIRLCEALNVQALAPFVALLIVGLPNVSKLQLSVGFFGDEYGNPYFIEPFLHVLEEHKALQRLKELTLLDSYDFGNSFFTGFYPAFTPSCIKSFLLRQSIRKLELFDLNLRYLPRVSDRLVPGISNVTHLTITCGEDSRFISARDSPLATYLRLPKALVSLTLYMRIVDSIGEYNHSISYDELWRALSKHNQTLEYLDLYDDIGIDKNHGSAIIQKIPMGTLSDFGRLTTLRVQAEVLVGGINNILKAPYRLRHALPPFLHSLTLYNFATNNVHGLINGRDLQVELFEIVTTTTLFDNLKFFLLQDTCENSLRNVKHGKDLRGRLEALQQACNDHSIVFKIMSWDQLPWGGVNLLRYPEAREPEKQALDHWKRGLDGLRVDKPERRDMSL